jgi:hypothetical protein
MHIFPHKNFFRERALALCNIDFLAREFLYFALETLCVAVVVA